MTDQNLAANNIADEKLLEEFVDRLIKEKNSPYVKDENRNEVKKMLLDDVADAINRKLVAQLTDKQVDELNVLLEKKVADEELNGFFKKNINNLDQIIAQALTDFRAGYLTVSYQPKKDDSDLPPPAPVNK
ncbi:hypothetical protein COS31_05370 [Candidatus Roizmanbacteria bacterium CG02_land_8_20_14_3_00_36_15]|uniref:Uncharacterized protein n=2 Tax=Candidatus Roizmaniibacteriota TaxID=1752723 RepID=A0A2M8KMR2_9BACT|nr:MAG: hypothetical protein COS51_04745 [Candidatus Roizmanbacteria bacterium CG03_land_8_20_14_0_80_36_21]PIV37306.1 MAG: hypothetical protein COS31_05370 [Candidatus Roizmanbacteria bacterium CG02_land_8_20_14_3_00_36_15]PIY70623.1 MAG: hypothetical protein COY89_00180 [Candidatus Roizmanbacteria bacterium CG_4_10_14_0_8_um_filter_36_36]PJA52447.1 MAG: hypothetical protein CO166_05785 [Candidatus Roizmanbacteria bacterium CG_4_9_14_3_um_filter_36_11]PJC81731.1 MAG: hypothetical protein CO007